MVSFTKHSRHFLLGRKFTVVTDHQALVWLHSVKDPSSRLMRWRLRLSDYDYEIRYRAGKTLQNADGLSRNAVNDSIAPVFMLQSNPKRKPGHPRKQVKFENVPEVRPDSLDDPGGFGIASRVRLRNRAARDREQTPHPAHEPAREAVLRRGSYLDSLADDADIDSEPEAPTARHCRKTLFNEEDKNYVPQSNNSENPDFNIERATTSSETARDHASRSTWVLPCRPDASDSESESTLREEQGDGTIVCAPEIEDSRNLNHHEPLNPTPTTSPLFHPKIYSTPILPSNSPSIAQHNFAHFISADGTLSSQASLTLLDLDFVRAESLRKCDLKKGQVVVSQAGSVKTLSIVLKENYYDHVLIENVLCSLRSLKTAMGSTDTSSVRISSMPGELDGLSSDTLKKIILEVFCGSNARLTICTGEVIEPPIDQRKTIIREYHPGLIGGHKGCTKTYRRIGERYCWLDIKREIETAIRHCGSCQKQKLVRIKTRQPMVITDTPSEPFCKIALDTVGPLPATPSGNRYILTMQDCFSKYCLAVPMPRKSAHHVPDAFARHLIAQFGTPKAILTDRGGEYNNQIFHHLSDIFKIKLDMTSAYHPQSNGSLERSHQVLADYLKHYVEDYEDWDRLLPFCMFSYNTSIHEATKFTPYELIFGRRARFPSSLPSAEQLQTYGSYVAELVTHLDDVRDIARQNLVRAKERSKEIYDRRLNERHFQVGDLVYVLREPWKNKLDSHYVGPYPIVEILEKNNVLLEDHSGHRILKHIDKIKYAYLPDPDMDF